MWIYPHPATYKGVEYFMKKRNILIISTLIVVLVSIGIYLFIQHTNKITLKESNFIFELGD